MGYNTTILIANDAYGAIDDDPVGWWARAKLAASGAVSGKPIVFGHGGYANHFTAITNYHADETALIAVGGNCASILYRGYGDHHEPLEQVALLKKAADALGYTVVRKRRR